MNLINFNKLTLDNIGQWPIFIKIGVIMGINILILTTGYWFIVKTNFEQYYILQLEENRLKTDFTSRQLQASSLQTYRNQLQLVNQLFNAMLRQLPARNEMPGLLEEISQTGVASGLKFELFAPQQEIQQRFYKELPIKIRVEGSYIQLALFISRVAQMNRIVTLHDFNIQEPVTRKSEDILVMDIIAKVYRYSAT